MKTWGASGFEMNKKKLQITYIFFDYLAAIVTWILFILLKQAVNHGLLFDNLVLYIPKFSYFKTFLLFPLLCMFFYYMSGFYISPERTSYPKLIFTTFISSILVFLSIFIVLSFDDVVVLYRSYYYSLLCLFLLSFFVTLVSRSVIFEVVKRNFKEKRWKINTIIVGTGNNAKLMAEQLEKNKKRNNLLGFVSVNNVEHVDKKMILGSIHQLDYIIPPHQIEEIIIALDNPDEQKLFSYINSLYKYNVDISFTPRLYEILTGSARIGSVGLNPLVCITRLNMPSWQISLKRFFDVVVSLVALIILSPAFLYFAIRIKNDSKGPAFFKQERIGYLGKKFDMVKFRSMYENAENGVPKLSNPDDPRITPFGKFLRKYRIDELPQFWNVLKGDMSIVGPRPERKFYVNQIIEQAPYYCLLYKVRPGLTSWGPIKIGYSDTIEKMVERLNYDIIYIENLSLLNDLKILLLTLEIIFKGKGV